MKRLFLSCQLFFFACTAFLLSGCMRFEYIGGEYAPLSEGKEPAFFLKRDKVPAGQYTIIGRAVLVVPGGTDPEDVKLRLLDEAASRGADAVCLVSQKKISEGLMEETQFSGPQSYNINPYNLTPDGARIKEDMNGETVDLKKDMQGTVKVIFKALFFKNKEELEKINAQRKKQLDDLIDPASRK